MANYKEVAVALAYKVCEELGLDKKHHKNYLKTIEAALEQHACDKVFQQYKTGEIELLNE